MQPNRAATALGTDRSSFRLAARQAHGTGTTRMGVAISASQIVWICESVKCLARAEGSLAEIWPG